MWVTTAGLSLYSELASMFPDRSGAEVVYLEQAYPRPRFLVSTSFAVIAILMSFVHTLLFNIWEDDFDIAFQFLRCKCNHLRSIHIDSL